jgi:hypothetical protein
MKSTKNNIAIKVLTTISFIIMITVNALANILPINHVTTGQVSDSYKNLFAPAGITFVIWGLIYLLLLGYVLYQLGLFQNSKSTVSKKSLKKIGVVFTISSFANATWILAWQYFMIGLSMILMITILICLIVITKEIKKSELSFRDNIFIRLPFSVYFGWITVATIANATALLVSLGWNGFGLSEPTWTVIIIVVGLIIGITTMLKNKDIAYGLVIIWAYIGILIKHVSSTGFNGKYPSVIATVIISIILLLISQIFLIISKTKKLS